MNTRPIVRRAPAPRCEWCGARGTDQAPVQETIVSPPVDGYRLQVAWMHGSCAGEAARQMVE